MNSRLRIQVTGAVQGVGFRPFVHGLATRLHLAGYVLNGPRGVTIEIEGEAAAVETFLKDLEEKAPSLAVIRAVSSESMPLLGETSFVIRESEDDGERSVLVLPDVATCPDCLREMNDPDDRRHNYPFINCTNCGPRYSIIRDMPYDRAGTTMSEFAMCDACRAEYEDPSNRRFHAEPTCCPDCGPRVWLQQAGTVTSEVTEGGTVPAFRIAPGGRVSRRVEVYRECLYGSAGASPYLETLGQIRLPSLAGVSPAASPIENAIRLLADGAILAIKGLGGFHLACDASNDEAVRRLRARKQRDTKPFALMVRDLDAARAIVDIPDGAETLLTGTEKPIVLLQKAGPSTSSLAPAPIFGRKPQGQTRGVSPGFSIVEGVAPNSARYGIMLPYTPLHYLLMQGPYPALVMTSGNLSDEPIAHTNDDGLARLHDIADYYLLHDRKIETRTDDSVVQWVLGAPHFLRRSRGYAPFPVDLPVSAPPILATGPELNVTVCLTRDNHAFLSHHIGDLDGVAAYDSFLQAVKHLKQILDVEPEAIACDLHPSMRTTRYAEKLQGQTTRSAWGSPTAQQELRPTFRVQHHHAHVASVMAEHGVTEPVIGVVYDGFGWGDDSQAWGGEFFISDLATCERVGHLKPMPLPGGDVTARRSVRMAHVYLREADIDFALEALSEAERNIIDQMLASGRVMPMTTSMGRLFDAAGAIIGVSPENTYEGRTPIELEALAWQAADDMDAYPVTLDLNVVQRPPLKEDQGGCKDKPNSLASEKCFDSDNIPRPCGPPPSKGDLSGADTFQVVGSSIIRSLVDDRRDGVEPAVCAARFHNTVAALTVRACEHIRAQHHLDTVVLSGGVFANVFLLERVVPALEDAAFRVLINRVVPPGDGGVSLGQAAVAAWRLSCV